METILKQAKLELNEFLTNKKANIKHTNHQHMSLLTITPDLETKKNQIKIELFFLKNELALDVKIKYIMKNEKKDLQKSYVFSDISKGKELLMISPVANEKLASIFKFAIIEDKLKSAIPLEDQLSTLLDILKSDWDNIIAYSKQI